MRDRFATHQLAGFAVASVWAVGFLDPHFLVTQPLEMIVAVDLPSGSNGLVKTTMKENELTNMLRWQELTCQQKKSI
jgi:hypothetical protein